MGIIFANPFEILEDKELLLFFSLSLITVTASEKLILNEQI